MKFGQLVEYNMKKIFLEKSYTKCGGETIPRHVPKNRNWEISKRLYFIQFVFIVCLVDGYQNVLKLSCEPLSFMPYK